MLSTKVHTRATTARTGAKKAAWPPAPFSGTPASRPRQARHTQALPAGAEGPWANSTVSKREALMLAATVAGLSMCQRCVG